MLQPMVIMNTNGEATELLLEPYNYGARELHVLLTIFSQSLVIESPFDENCIPFYFCPILQVIITLRHIPKHETYALHCS